MPEGQGIHARPMTDQPEHSVLRRMTQRTVAAPQEVPLTSSRAVRVAVKRAADSAHGLSVTVEGLQEEVFSLDGIADALGADWLLLGLYRDGALAGLAAADQQLRSAVIELQTIGKVLETVAGAREPTNTDAMMFTPFMAALLKSLADTTPRTDLDGWTEGVQVGARVTTTRSAALSLPEHDYRLVRLVIDLGVGDRQGGLAILLPAGTKPVAEVVLPSKGAVWHPGFRNGVAAAPACLTAELHRFKLPLCQIEGFQAGQLIPLSGCTVASVKLTDANGREAAKARLGQYAGMRAVRIEFGKGIEMSELGPAGPPHTSARADPTTNRGTPVVTKF